MTAGELAVTADPVLFHVHGIAGHDFTAMGPDDLPSLQREADQRSTDLVPTIFLRRGCLPNLVAVLTAYGHQPDRYPRILGFAIEGPMLGPRGGTPAAASWVPTKEDWHEIAALGKWGLRYVVLAPDKLDLGDALCPGFLLRDLVELFYSSGVKIALGHFRHDDPQRSAERATAMIEFVASLASQLRPALLTDHLYNDMPRDFRHAWRGEAAVRREDELREFLRTPWEPESLDQLLGPVPAALLAGAQAGDLMPCMNFDGAHVDLGICKRTVEYLGAERLIAITDHVEDPAMGGETLHMADDTTLWLREDGVVAAGSQGIVAHVRNMQQIGMSHAEIGCVLSENPRRAAEGPS